MLTITYSGHHDSFNYKRKLSWHAHSCPEIIYVIRGENMTHFENGEVFYCQHGSLLITPPNLPTPVFLPGESHGQRILAGYSPWGHKESDTTEHNETTNKRRGMLALWSLFD